MNGYHVSGAAIGALIGFVASNYGWSVPQDEALSIGAACAAVGGGLIHLFTGPGLVPAVKRALFGAKVPPAA